MALFLFPFLHNYMDLTIMEIEGQLATVISGGAASLLLTKVPLYWILCLDACTYAVAIACLFFIPYHRSVRNSETHSFWNKMTEGCRYMKARPLLFCFLLASFMPFIGVMMTNYLHPIYITDVMNLPHLSKWGFPVFPSGWMRDRMVGSLSAGNAWHPSRWEPQAT